MQGALPISQSDNLDRLHKLSYYQKTYAMLVVVEQSLLNNTDSINKNKLEHRTTSSFNPALSNKKWINRFEDFQRTEGVTFRA